MATEWHVLVNLSDLREKEKNFLLDVLGFVFGTTVETVAGKFKEVKARSAASKGPDPSGSGTIDRARR